MSAALALETTTRTSLLRLVHDVSSTSASSTATQDGAKPEFGKTSTCSLQAHCAQLSRFATFAQCFPSRGRPERGTLSPSSIRENPTSPARTDAWEGAARAGQRPSTQAGWAGRYCDGLDNDCNSATPDVCPTHCTGYVQNGTSYMACSDPHTWDASEVRCQAQAMHLVRIDDAAEDYFLFMLGKGLAQRVWIGASDEATSGSFAWTNGTLIYTSGAVVSGVYTQFASGQPGTMTGPNCVQIYTSSGSQEGQWFAAGCGSNAPYICERY